MDTRERILERHLPLVAIGPEIIFMKASIILQSVSGFQDTLWGGSKVGSIECEVSLGYNFGKVVSRPESDVSMNLV